MRSLRACLKQLEAELRRLIPQWEAAHGRPFLVNGVSFIEGLDEQIRAEEQEKENRKVRESSPSMDQERTLTLSTPPVPASEAGR